MAQKAFWCLTAYFFISAIIGVVQGNVLYMGMSTTDEVQLFILSLPPAMFSKYYIKKLIFAFLCIYFIFTSQTSQLFGNDKVTCGKLKLHALNKEQL